MAGVDSRSETGSERQRAQPGEDVAGTSGQLLVANGSGVPTFVTMSGDATIAADGTVTVANDSHTHSGYATTTLNNLGTTAINADLLPSGSRNLGSNTARWTSRWLPENECVDRATKWTFP